MTYRNKYVDLLKGLAMILVIIPHCIQYGSGNTYLNECMFYDNPIFKFIYSFHMPVFMLISGYLFKYSIIKHSFSTLIKNRITTLIIPIFIWHSLYIIIKYFIFGDGTLNNFYYSSYLKCLWFLWAVFWNSIIILLVHKFAKDSILIYFLLFIISLFIPHIFNSNYYIFMYPYFFCGYYLNGFSNLYINKLVKISFSPYSIIIISIIFILMLTMYSRDDYVYVSGTNIIKSGRISFKMINTNLFRWSIGFIGSFLFYAISMNYYNQKRNNDIFYFFEKIGTRTLGIYIISDYSFRFFYLLPIESLNYFIITIEIICITCASYIFTWLIEKNHFTRKLLLGGR